MANRDNDSEQMSSESSIEKYKDLLTPDQKAKSVQLSSKSSSVKSLDISEEEKKADEEADEVIDLEEKKRKKTPPPKRRGAILGFDDR